MTSGETQVNSLSSSRCTKSQNVRVERRIISHAVEGTIRPSLDVLMEKHVEDYWNENGEKNYVMHGQTSQDSSY